MATTIQPTKQRIAIDTVFFNRQFSGITRVWINILNNIISSSIKDNFPYEVILFIRGIRIPLELDIPLYKKYFTYIHINEFNYVTMYQDVDHLDQICKINQVTMFFSTYFTYTTIIPNILLIHDMIPEVYKFHRNHMWIQKDLAIKNASAFITISKTTQNDLFTYYPHIKLNNYPIYLIYNAITSTPQPTPLLQPNTAVEPLQPQYDTNFINNFLAAQGVLPKKYIFTIASNTENYKNMKLITDFADKYSTKLQSLLQTKTPIVSIVKKPLKNGFEITNNMLLISHVPEKILNTLYKYALVFVCPSQYEGFGLPVFEAFIHETPVITLDIPIFHELCKNAVHFISDDCDELYDKITNITKQTTNNQTTNNQNIAKRILQGKELIKFYNESNILGYEKMFTEIDNINKPHAFLNVIIQSYNENDVARRAEIEYCILANLNNPYVSKVHDFGKGDYLPVNITQHPKYINAHLDTDSIIKWLKYKDAFMYANNNDNQSKYGNYWCLINCDIFLDGDSKWQLIRSYLNNEYIMALSRHEYIPNTNTDTNSDTKPQMIIKMDEKFSKTLHANTQDGWFFSTPLKPLLLETHLLETINFEIGLLGCDNAIADRLIQCGYKVINQPLRFKIIHYDIARGKNSSNFLEKHNTEHKNKQNKPKNTHPESSGSYLLPNYDQMINEKGEIDLISFISNLGGISNWERYKIICELFSSRIIIQNPE